MEMDVYSAFECNKSEWCVEEEKWTEKRKSDSDYIIFKPLNNGNFRISDRDFSTCVLFLIQKRILHSPDSGNLWSRFKR